MALAGTKLLGRDVARLAYNAGWRDKNLILAVAIAHAESSLYTRAENDNNPDGSIDRGIFQVNSAWIGRVVDGKTIITADNLFDPAFNAHVAHMIYKGRSYTFDPWVAYTSGAYEEHLDAAIGNVGNMWRTEFGIPIPTS